MVSRNALSFLSIILFNAMAFCQNQADEMSNKSGTVLYDYFDLEREAIHLHLNKTTFMNHEAIWYQGYIFNRKTNKPFLTTNVFVLFYDETGQLLQEKLVHASNA